METYPEAQQCLARVVGRDRRQHDYERATSHVAPEGPVIIGYDVSIDGPAARITQKVFVRLLGRRGKNKRTDFSITLANIQ